MTLAQLAGNGLFWTGLATALAVLYFLPSIIGITRGTDQLWIILLLNLAPIAWPAALAGAIILPRKDRPQPRPAPAQPCLPPPGPCTGRTAQPPPAGSPAHLTGLFLGPWAAATPTSGKPAA